MSQLGLGTKLSDAWPTVLITTARGLLRKVIPRRVMDDSAELLGKGSSIDRDELTARPISLAGRHVCRWPRTRRPSRCAAG